MTSPTSNPTSGYVIGVDIGGTFTDCVVLAPDGSMVGAKSPTTPENRSLGFFGSIEVAAEKLGMTARELFARCERVVHGTTTGTNAIVSRDGAVTGLITTAGQSDIMFLMGGGGRTSGLAPEEALHVPSTDKPEPLVPKRLIAQVSERVDVDGDVVVALDEDAVRVAIRRLVKDEGVTALAVSLLWSIRNNVHERRIKEIAAEEAPHVFTCCASDLVSQVGEYERTTTTVMNAYIGPLMTRYIDSIVEGAAERGFTGSVLFAQCAGGAITDEEAKAAPIRTVQSGPVAGIVSSEMLARRIDTDNVLLADMGGTTFDVSVIRGGHGLRRNTSMFQRYELALPMLDVESIGAGGGSIAWVDASGRLNVGPKSAGAWPGPACYGNGGTEATVTDADVVLGFIDPATFLNGRMTIRPELAEQAVQRVADKLGLDLYEAAAGINRIVDSKMADLIRRMSVLRGLDPRKFAMYAFGGGGPVHATEVARQAGVKKVIVPSPSVAAMWSALGAAVADVTYVYQEPKSFRLPVHGAELDLVFDRLEGLAESTAAGQGLGEMTSTLTRSVRMKYRMQVHDVEVPVIRGTAVTDVLDVENRFNELYEAQFGVGSGFREGGSEITAFQVQFHGITSKPPLPSREITDSPQTMRSRRQVYWSEEKRMIETQVIRLDTEMVTGAILGPALMELPDTVVLIRPGQSAEFDQFGNLVITTGQ